MTEGTFRRLALQFPETAEGAHMGHPDFRVRGKIFATLWPMEKLGMLKLTPAQQAEFVKAAPKSFVPVKGGWGKRGATHVRLSSVNTAAAQGALIAAWLNHAPKDLIAEFEAQA